MKVNADIVEDLFGLFLFAIVMILIFGLLDSMVSNPAFENTAALNAVGFAKAGVVSFLRNFLLVTAIAIPVAVVYFVIKREFFERA